MSDKKVDRMNTDKSICRMGGIATFAKDDGSDGNNIRLEMYDGGVTKHWYWGNIAFDLKSMKLAKKSVGILQDHDPSKRVGYSTGADFDGKFVLTGRFLEGNADAQQLRSDAKEGFPFEASMSFDSDNAEIIRLADGEKHEINGKTMKGPGTAVYKAIIREGSITPFGALNNTKTQVFNDNILDEKGQDMAKTELTLETFKADHTELHDTVFGRGKAEGEKAERDLFASITKACPDAAIAATCFIEGKSPQEAKDAFNDSEITKLRDKNAKLADDLKTANENKGKKNDPADGEFAASDDASEEDNVGENDGDKTDEQLKKKFADDKKLQSEFGGSFEDYASFVKMESDGRVNIPDSME